jgi:putative spermidine/putrescine transport system substrate-binding protein
MKLFRISTFKFALIFVAVALIAGIGMPKISNARDLTIVSWGGAYQEAQRKAYFDPFMKKTGGKVLDESYNGEMAKIRAMVESNNVTWDVVQVESPELINACEQGLLEIIDWKRVGGKEIFIPTAIMGECGVGTIVWTHIIAYDADKIKGEGPKNWADFWNVKKWPGKRALRKNAKPSLEIAMVFPHPMCTRCSQAKQVSNGLLRNSMSSNRICSGGKPVHSRPNGWLPVTLS